MGLRRLFTMIPPVAAVVLVASLAVACAPRLVAFHETGRSLERSAVIDAVRSAKLGAAADASPDDAARIRTEALTELRSHGEQARRLADAMTAQLPADYTGIPAYVEYAQIDGRACWLVVEALPATGEGQEGPARRYWIFDAKTLGVVESGALEPPDQATP